MSWTRQPAVFVDRHLTVLASNPLAEALSPAFSEGVNLVRFTFLDPRVTRVGEKWNTAAAQIAQLLRESLDQHDEDRAFLSIVGELSAKSRDFSEAWAEESSMARPAGEVTFLGTEVGTITLGYYLARIPENFDDTLIIFGPLEGSTATDLEQLAALLDRRLEGGRDI